MQPSLPPTNPNSQQLLTTYSESERPWDTHRAQADFIETIYAKADSEWISRYSARIKLCAQVLEYGFETDSDGLIKFSFKRTSFCRVRYCAVCQWRRSLKWKARLLQAAPELKEIYPKARWVFLTLTLKNCDTADLRATVQAMAYGFLKLTKQKKWPALGWIRSLEVTHAPDGKSHPHYHVLMMVRPGYFGSQYVTQDEFSAMWQKAMRLDYKPVCHIKAIKGKDGRSAAEEAAAETLKYSVKPDEAIDDGAWLIQITEQLFKVRGVTVGGVLREFMREDEPAPDEDEPVVMNEGGFLFQYEKIDQQYYNIKDSEVPKSYNNQENADYYHRKPKGGAKSQYELGLKRLAALKESHKAAQDKPCAKCGQQFLRLAYNQKVCKTCIEGG